MSFQYVHATMSLDSINQFTVRDIRFWCESGVKNCFSRKYGNLQENVNILDKVLKMNLNVYVRTFS